MQSYNDKGADVEHPPMTCEPCRVFIFYVFKLSAFHVNLLKYYIYVILSPNTSYDDLFNILLSNA
jgi:hypothetical protein